jgi:hypothetical protein
VPLLVWDISVLQLFSKKRLPGDEIEGTHGDKLWEVSSAHWLCSLPLTILPTWHELALPVTVVSILCVLCQGQGEHDEHTYKLFVVHLKRSYGFSGEGWTGSSSLHELLGRKRKHLFPRLSCFKLSLFILGCENMRSVLKCEYLTTDCVHLTKTKLLSLCWSFCLFSQQILFGAVQMCVHLQYVIWVSQKPHKVFRTSSLLHISIVWKLRLKKINTLFLRVWGKNRWTYKCQRMFV